MVGCPHPAGCQSCGQVGIWQRLVLMKEIVRSRLRMHHHTQSVQQDEIPAGTIIHSAPEPTGPLQHSTGLKLMHHLWLCDQCQTIPQTSLVRVVNSCRLARPGAWLCSRLRAGQPQQNPPGPSSSSQAATGNQDSGKVVQASAYVSREPGILSAVVAEAETLPSMLSLCRTRHKTETSYIAWSTESLP